MKVFILSVLFNTLFLGHLIANGFQPYCTFISEKSGVVSCNAPSLKTGIKDSLLYGDVIRVVEKTGKTEKIKHRGKKVTAEWLKIIAPGWKKLKPSREEGYEAVNDSDYSYILDIYTSFFLKEIPTHSIYNYYHFGLYSNSFQMGYPDSPTDYFIDGPEGCQCNCYPYYGGNISNPNFSDYNKAVQNSEVGENDSKFDTLKNYLHLELVDIKKYRNKRVRNKYDIDTAQVQKKTPDSLYFSSFYLYLENGDSLLFKEEPGEVHVNTYYSGQMPYLNKYMVNYYYETPSHYLIDKTDGKQTQFTPGVPYVSPTGRFVVDFYHAWSYGSTDGCSLAISRLNDTLGLSSILTVDFKSWLAAEDGFQPFWVSDNELIIKVYPVDNYMYYHGPAPDKFNYQYLKVKVLNY